MKNAPTLTFITALFFGILAASLALIAELVLLTGAPVFLTIPETSSPKTLLSLIGIACIEETAKYILLRQYIVRFLPAKTLLAQSPLVLGISFGIGFSILEILLIQKITSTLPALASLGIISLHIITSGVLALTLCSYSEKRFSVPIALVITIYLHTLFNIIVLI